MAPTTPRRIMRRAAVTARTGLPRSTLYDAIRRGDFPAPVKISTHTVGWYSDEVDTWLATRPRTRTAA